jgi:hypothetical protein
MKHYLNEHARTREQRIDILLSIEKEEEEPSIPG